jgi:zinc D-Ala-D-Ala carboxypeptidase
MKLSANFSLAEMIKSSTAIRKGIDNTPDEVVTANLQALVDNVLQVVRDKFGSVKVTSGYRSPLLNSSIGGSKTSQHCYGFAADFEVTGLDNKELAIWIRDNLQFTQLILEFYIEGDPNSGWVHCAYDAKDLKAQVLTATKVDGKTKYVTGIQ